LAEAIQWAQRTPGTRMTAKGVRNIRALNEETAR
jgi:hypothetical protein